MVRSADRHQSLNFASKKVNILLVIVTFTIWPVSIYVLLHTLVRKVYIIPVRYNVFISLFVKMFIKCKAPS